MPSIRSAPKDRVTPPSVPRLPRATTPIFSPAVFAETFPKANPKQFFPGLARPAPIQYVKAYATPLPVSDVSDFIPSTTSLTVHRRLLRLLPLVPSVAVFPYIVGPMHSKANRQSRIKEGDERFCFPLASFMAWELGTRTVRLGVFESMLGPDERSGGKTHMWVGVLFNIGEGRGKGILYFDDSADHLRNRIGNDIERADIFRPQKDLPKRLTKEYELDIRTVWWGGTKKDVSIDMVEGLFCLESAMRFAEMFSEEVEEAGGEVSQGLIDKWHMVEV